jgi:hypothetical protein
MRKRHSTVRARVRVNEFAIEFEENLRIRWQLQKHNRAPLFAKYEQPQRVRFPLLPAEYFTAAGRRRFWASLLLGVST